MDVNHPPNTANTDKRATTKCSQRFSTNRIVKTDMISFMVFSRQMTGCPFCQLEDASSRDLLVEGLDTFLDEGAFARRGWLNFMQLYLKLTSQLWLFQSLLGSL